MFGRPHWNHAETRLACSLLMKFQLKADRLRATERPAIGPDPWEEAEMEERRLQLLNVMPDHQDAQKEGGEDQEESDDPWGDLDFAVPGTDQHKPAPGARQETQVFAGDQACHALPPVPTAIHVDIKIEGNRRLLRMVSPDLTLEQLLNDLQVECTDLAWYSGWKMVKLHDRLGFFAVDRALCLEGVPTGAWHS